MASIQSYQHKKFSLKTEEYSHKKFGLHMNKRKYEELENLKNITPITAETILQQANKEIQNEPLPKRRQIKPLFRPWLEEEDNTKTISAQTTDKPSQLVSPNIISTEKPQQLSEKYHQKRSRNTLACVLKRRQQQAEQLRLQQQYFAYHQQQQQKFSAMQQYQQPIKSYLTLQQLQQLSLQRQQLLFVFGIH